MSVRVPLGMQGRFFPTRALVRKARMVLSTHAVLREQDVPECARVLPMHVVRRSRWWRTLARRVDVRWGDDEWDAETLFAVGSSRAHEDALHNNDYDALRATDDLQFLAEPCDVFLHQHTGDKLEPAGTALRMRVTWSAVRRDGGTAWVVLEPRAADAIDTADA